MRNKPLQFLFEFTNRVKTQKVILIILGSSGAATHSASSLSDTLTWSRTETFWSQPAAFFDNAVKESAEWTSQATVVLSPVSFRREHWPARRYRVTITDTEASCQRRAGTDVCLCARRDRNPSCALVSKATITTSRGSAKKQKHLRLTSSFLSL